MLTVKINESHLEKSIAEKALLIGKSPQEIVKDLLRNALPESKEGLFYQKLNPEEYGYVINTEVEDQPLDEKIILFSYVDDTVKYVENLRKNAWRK